MIPFWIPIACIAGGTWITQDAICSILYYIGKENWHFNHAARIIRGLVGIVFIVIGVRLLWMS